MGGVYYFLINKINLIQFSLPAIIRNENKEENKEEEGEVKEGVEEEVEEKEFSFDLISLHHKRAISKKIKIKIKIKGGVLFVK